MIKLTRTAPPEFLSLEKAKELTERYMLDGKAVWQDKKIKDALLDQSFGKCAYCECDLSKESNYMEVEHFYNKKDNPNRVVAWSNLLPACKRCNIHKSDHDTLEHPIINPFEDIPKHHLRMHTYRYKSKTSLGSMTIDVLNLNQTDRCVTARFEIGEAIHISLSSARDKLARYLQRMDSVPLRNAVISAVRLLLLECQPQSSYSATAATVLHGDEDYENIKSSLIAQKIWSDELEQLDHISRLASLS